MAAARDAMLSRVTANWPKWKEGSGRVDAENKEAYRVRVLRVRYGVREGKDVWAKVGSGEAVCVCEVCHRGEMAFLVFVARGQRAGASERGHRERMGNGAGEKKLGRSRRVSCLTSWSAWTGLNGSPTSSSLAGRPSSASFCTQWEA